MKKITTILLCYIFIFNSNICLTGQKTTPKKPDWNCYTPDGLKCKEDKLISKNFGELKKNFEEKGRCWDAVSDIDDEVVVFKALSKTPLFIITKHKNYSAEKITEVIESINRDNASYSFYWEPRFTGLKYDLDKFIKKNVLDDSYIINNLGFPNEIKETLYGGEKARMYLYKTFNIRLYVRNNNVVGFDEIEN